MEKKVINPVLVLALSATVIAAGATNLVNGAVVACAMLVVLVLANVITKALSSLTGDLKRASEVVVIAGLSGMVAMLVNAFAAATYAAVAPCFTVMAVELSLYALVEEDLGSACKAWAYVLVAALVVGAVRQCADLAGVSVMAGPCGGLLVLACVMAVFNKGEKKVDLTEGFLKEMFNNKVESVEEGE